MLDDNISFEIAHFLFKFYFRTNPLTYNSSSPLHQRWWRDFDSIHQVGNEKPGLKFNHINTYETLLIEEICERLGLGFVCNNQNNQLIIFALKPNSRLEQVRLFVEGVLKINIIFDDLIRRPPPLSLEDLAEACKKRLIQEK